MKSNRRFLLGVALAAATLAAYVGTALGSASAGAKPIVIGSTLPLSGPLATLGQIVATANKQAVAEANQKGGIVIGGTKHTVKLVVLDNKSDPNQVTQQARRLVLDEHAVALLGSFTPPLSIPLSNVAEQLKVPALFTNTPVLAWQSANKAGWKYAWDAFVNEAQQTTIDYEAARLANTNKRVALFTDTEEDGFVFGKLWEQEAARYGFTVVYRAKFPPLTVDYSQYIEQAKAANADVLFSIMIPPDGIALFKQAKGLGWSPKVASCEKCSHTRAWPPALGELGQGTVMFGWWAPDFGYLDTAHIMALWGKKYGLTTDLETAATNYGLAKVLLNAIRRADSTVPAKINAALATTNENSAAGHVKFDRKHTFTIKAFARQWQGNRQVRIWPTGKGAAKMIAPLPGFAR